jgi:hypothetical protein
LAYAFHPSRETRHTTSVGIEDPIAVEPFDGVARKRALAAGSPVLSSCAALARPDGPALALVGSATGATASVDIREHAVAVQGGQAVLVFVEVECTLSPGEELLEGNISVSQNDASGLAGLNPVCNGQRRVYPIRVTSFGGTFESGEAFASAFLLFINTATQQTTQASDSTVITIR